jgi:putative transposase
MARQPRLSVAGQLHLVMQRSHNASTVFRGDDDYRSYLDCLRASLPQHGVLLHAYMLVPDRVVLLATPPAADSLARLLQALGRRFGAEYNRRHGRSGSLWDGRFRCTVAEASTQLLDCIRYVESGSAMTGGEVIDYPWSSAAHHAGRRVDPLVSEHAEYWRLGNTPFEREARYRALIEEPLSAATQRRIGEACLKGWALGGPSYIQAIEQQTQRSAAPRRRGRPPRLTGKLAKEHVPI